MKLCHNQWRNEASLSSVLLELFWSTKLNYCFFFKSSSAGQGPSLAQFWSIQIHSYSNTDLDLGLILSLVCHPPIPYFLYFLGPFLIRIKWSYHCHCRSFFFKGVFVWQFLRSYLTITRTVKSSYIGIKWFHSIKGFCVARAPFKKNVIKKVFSLKWCILFNIFILNSLAEKLVKVSSTVFPRGTLDNTQIQKLNSKFSVSDSFTLFPNQSGHRYHSPPVHSRCG